MLTLVERHQAMFDNKTRTELYSISELQCFRIPGELRSATCLQPGRASLVPPQEALLAHDDAHDRGRITVGSSSAAQSCFCTIPIVYAVQMYYTMRKLYMHERQSFRQLWPHKASFREQKSRLQFLRNATSTEATQTAIAAVPTTH